MSNIGCNDAGFNEGFTIIYRRYSKAVKRFLYRFVYNDSISEELCQEVFLKVVERKKILDPDAPQTLSFLFKTAKNTAIDYVRRKKGKRKKSGA